MKAERYDRLMEELPRHLVALEEVIRAREAAIERDTVQIHFPCQLLALAYSRQGEALLEGFNFFKLQHASTMPDRAPLFCLQLPDRDHRVARP